MPVDVWSVPAYAEPTPTKPAPEPTPLVVRIADQIIVFPRTTFGPPQCVAAGRKSGTRCTGVVQDDYHGFSDWPILNYGGSISALEHNESDEGYLRQRCGRHIESSAPNVIEPEWERFDPDRHQSLISVHRSFWTPDGLRTRGLEPQPEFGDTPPRIEEEAVGTFAELLAKAEQDRAARRLTESTDTALYSYYDAADVSLYIGITDDLRRRTLDHLEASSWMDFAARSTITRYPNRQAALDAEKAAIEAEHPLFNHVHNDTPEARQRLVAYLIEHGRTDLLAPAISRG